MQDATSSNCNSLCLLNTELKDQYLERDSRYVRLSPLFHGIRHFLLMLWRFLPKGCLLCFHWGGAPARQKSMDAHGHTILGASSLFRALDVPANLHGFKRAQLFHLKATFQLVNAFWTSKKEISHWYPDCPHTILYQQAVQGTMVI